MSVIINPNLKDYFIMIGGDAPTVQVKNVIVGIVGEDGKLNNYNFTLKKGKKQELDLVVEPPEAINFINYSDVIWTSSNPKVASIDRYGIVTALKEGTTRITGQIGKHKAYINCKVIDVIEFADPLTKKLCLKLWDKDGDGELTYTEAAKVQYITPIFANSKITSFDELKYFVNLKGISPGSFQGCSYLESITFPNKLETVGKRAFYDCDSLETITFPATTNSIGYESLANCEKLTYVVVNSVTPPVGSYMFADDDPKLYSIKVPEDYVDDYVVADGWEEYRSYINPTGFDYTFDFYLS